MDHSQRQSPLRMALIGGGGAGFIGKVHATAATLDREAVLVAGALSSDPVRAVQAASQFGIDPKRAYPSFGELLEQESRLPPTERVDFISIATPNHTHYEIARAALAAGFHVVCDKPMTTNLNDADELARVVRSSGRVFALMHNYSGYPMIRQARDMVEAGEIGELIAVRASYVQGWMHGVDPNQQPVRGGWKSDPQKNGLAGSLGDVGTHAFQLARYVSRLSPSSLMAKMESYSSHHDLDDYGHAIIQFENQATGLITWSQVSHGRLNDLQLEVDGAKATLSWRQEEPNQLTLRSLGEPTRIFERNPNADYSSANTVASCRLPGGHPEAFFEAFANVYRAAFVDMRQSRDPGDAPAKTFNPPPYPTAQDGQDTVRFMARCLASQQSGSNWQPW